MLKKTRQSYMAMITKDYNSTCIFHDTVKYFFILFLLKANYIFASDSSECALWNSIYKNAFTGFEDFRGPFNKESENYFATTFFPNAKSCLISEDKFKYSYTCNWVYDLKNENLAMAEASSFSDFVRACMKREKRKKSGLVVGRKAILGSTMVYYDSVWDKNNRAQFASIQVSRRAESKAKDGKLIRAAGYNLSVRINFRKY